MTQPQVLQALVEQIGLLTPGLVADDSPPPKELPEEMLDTLQAFANAKALARFANQQKDLLELEIRAALDGAKVGTINGREVVKLTESHNSHLDAGVVQSGWPEAYTAAYRRTDYDYVTVKLRGVKIGEPVTKGKSGKKAKHAAA